MQRGHGTHPDPQSQEPTRAMDPSGIKNLQPSPPSLKQLNLLSGVMEDTSSARTLFPWVFTPTLGPVLTSVRSQVRRRAGKTCLWFSKRMYERFRIKCRQSHSQTDYSYRPEARTIFISSVVLLLCSSEIWFSQVLLRLVRSFLWAICPSLVVVHPLVLFTGITTHWLSLVPDVRSILCQIEVFLEFQLVLLPLLKSRHFYPFLKIESTFLPLGSERL